MKKTLMGPLCASALAMIGIVATAHGAGIAEHASRFKLAGIDVIVYPTAVKDVVTLAGTFPAGDAFAARDNVAIATLTGMMLDKGTAHRDRFAIAQALEDVGAELRFRVGKQTVSIQGKALKDDLPRLIQILAEELREPAFSPEELAKARKQLEGTLRQKMEDTDFRTRQAFLQSVFPAGHPNHTAGLDDWLAAVDAATLEQVTAFHRKYYGPSQLTLVFAGSVDNKTIQSEVTKAFSGWTGGVEAVRGTGAAELRILRVQKIPVAQKTSVSLLLGQPTGLRYQDPDSLALRVGTAILGSGFTGRLMSTVRDQDGLTYGIGAAISDDEFVGGTFAISATFAPALLDKGIAASRRALAQWWQSGVTEEELAARKTNLVGRYEIGLSTAAGVARTIVATVERGKPLAWLDDYPKAIEALTVEQVDAAIKKHLDPEKMVLVTAGTFEAAH
jgi:zinc protease